MEALEHTVYQKFRYFTICYQLTDNLVVLMRVIVFFAFSYSN